jgi:putative Holliday junction resolvase
MENKTENITMPIVAIKELKAVLPAGLRLMGIDQGSKTLGLAISTPDLTMATPLTVIMRNKFKEDVQKLSKLCKEYGVGGFIVGLPLNMDGTAGARCESVKHFADNLMAAKDVLGFDPAIAFYDERLTTDAVEDFFDQQAEAGVKITRVERDKIVDKIAAQFILQGALDEMGRNRG